MAKLSSKNQILIKVIVSIILMTFTLLLQKFNFLGEISIYATIFFFMLSIMILINVYIRSMMEEVFREKIEPLLDRNDVNALFNSLRFYFKSNNSSKPKVVLPNVENQKLLNISDLIEKGDPYSERLYDIFEDNSQRVVFIAYSKSKTNTFIKEHFHNSNEHIFLIEGKWGVDVKYEKRKEEFYEMKEHDHLKVPSNVPHSIEIDSGSKAVLFWTRKD